MKNSSIVVLFCALFLALSPSTVLAAAAHFPEVKIIVSARRIWLIADEMPVKNLPVKIFNAAGKVVVDKQFSSKTADWSLDLTVLPAGEYTVVAGTQSPVHFRK